MALCINPTCPSPNHPNNAVQSHCQACGANLTIQGRYRVMRLLTDRSGFGRVYEVFERDQPKILKVLKETYNSNAKAIQLFEQEALVLGHLDHPGVPRIDVDGCFQVIPKEGAEPLHCIVMEKVDGPNLSEWMRQQGNHPISERQAVQWLQQLAEVLHLVHQQRYFHRDIKPDNVMLRSSGQLVLVDFGAVREMSFTYFEQLEATGGITRISSAGYTPPEQERGQAVPQSDFFSLGCTFMYLLTGKKPTDVDIYRSMTNEYHWRPFAPHISPQLADFIDRLMAPRVVDRPTSTLELLAKVKQLQLALGELPQGNQGDPAQAGSQGLSGVAWGDRPFPQTSPNAMHYGGQPVYHPAANQQITSPPYAVPPEFPDAMAPTASTYVQISNPISGHQLATQPYEIYESSAIPADAEPYPDSNASGRLTHQPPASVATVALSQPLHRRAWRWMGVGLGLIALTGVAVWGGRSLFLPSPEPVTETTRSLKVTSTSVLPGHTGAVNILVLSLDGQTLVSGSNDGTVRIWDLATGGERQQLGGDGDRIQAVAISPNGSLFASGSSESEIRLWDGNTGGAIATLPGHTSSINHLIITPDGKTLISASADKTIKLWDLDTLTEIVTLTGHTSYINQLSLSPDGNHLASAAADKTIKIWDLDKRTEISTLTGHTSAVNTVVFSHDSRRLISGGADNQIKIWDTSSDFNPDQPVATLETHTSYVNDLQFIPGARWFISASADGTLIVWDLNTLEPMQTIDWPNTFINTAAIRRNGATWQLVAGGDGDYDIQVWDIER